MFLELSLTPGLKAGAIVSWAKAQFYKDPIITTFSISENNDGAIFLSDMFIRLKPPKKLRGHFKIPAVKDGAIGCIKNIYTQFHLCKFMNVQSRWALAQLF